MILKNRILLKWKPLDEQTNQGSDKTENFDYHRDVLFKPFLHILFV